MVLENFLTFTTVEDAYIYLLGTTLNNGRDLPEQNCIEIFGVGFRVTRPMPSNKLLKVAGIPIPWAEKEFQERISKKSINPGEAWQEWKAFWAPKLVGGKFDYTYSERCSPQLDALITKLKTDSTTRRAILLIYYPNDINSKGRVPCTVASQYVIRNNKLCSLYLLRSSDIVNLLPADLYHYIRLQQWLSKELGIQMDTFALVIGSLHIYYKDREKAIAILKCLKRGET